MPTGAPAGRALGAAAFCAGSNGSATGGAPTSRIGATPHAVSAKPKKIAPRRTMVALPPGVYPGRP
jgi:hypothetical protein